MNSAKKDEMKKKKNLWMKLTKNYFTIYMNNGEP